MSDTDFDSGGYEGDFSGVAGATSFSPRQQFRLLGACVFLLVVATWAGCSEIRYSLYGQTTQARITNLDIYKPRRSGEMINVRFAFLDTDRSQRIESFGVPIEQQSAYTKGATITVQYIPLRPGTARRAGESNWWLTLPIFIAAGATAYFVWRFLKDFKAYKAHESRSLARGV